MNSIIYKLPVIRKIHELHLMIDELHLAVDELKKINISHKRELSRLQKEKLSRNEFNKTCNEIRREMRYDFFRGLPKEKYKEALCDWYYLQKGKRLDLEHPKTFNEKIQWLKLNDSTPLKTKLTDKIAVREWVKQKIGEQYLIPCLGVWDCFEEIDFDALPERFVLKANHGSSWNVIVTDKKSFDKEDARKKFHDWLGRNYAWHGLELQYKNIPPRIYAEEYMENAAGDLYDYKFVCFDGRACFVWVNTERFTRLQRTIYDLDWNRQNFSVTWPQSKAEIIKPDSFEEMKMVVQKLCEGFSFVRVDLYNISGKIYFGEMTFTSENGICQFEPEEYDAVLGEMITLPDTREKQN